MVGGQLLALETITPAGYAQRGRLRAGGAITKVKRKPLPNSADRARPCCRSARADAAIGRNAGASGAGRELQRRPRAQPRVAVVAALILSVIVVADSSVVPAKTGTKACSQREGSGLSANARSEGRSVSRCANDRRMDSSVRWNDGRGVRREVGGISRRLARWRRDTRGKRGYDGVEVTGMMGAGRAEVVRGGMRRWCCSRRDTRGKRGYDGVVGAGMTEWVGAGRGEWRFRRWRGGWRGCRCRR